MSAQETTGSTVKNIIAIVGFVILLIIGIWSAIQVITFVPRLFSSTGVSSTQQVASTGGIELGDRDIVARLSTDTAQSGTPVTIEWAHRGGDEGVVSFSYACDEGFYFQIAGRPVPCNAPYNIPATDTSLEVVPLSAKKTVRAPLAITYTNPQGESVRDTLTLTIENGSIVEEAEQEAAEDGARADIDDGKEGTVATTGGPVEPVQPTTVQDTKSAYSQKNVSAPRRVVRTVLVPRRSNPYGTADLKVEMVAIGDINPYGAFEPKGIVHYYARGGAKFKVTNLGDKETGPWHFVATLPTLGGYPFTSQVQPSLMPGASIEIFMTFDQLVPGVHTFSVHVDPLNQIPELSEFNNTAVQNLTVLNY